jgi:hypothetical protein
MAPTDRTKQFHLLFSDEEHSGLAVVAAYYNMSATDYVRWLIGWHLSTVHAEHLQAKNPAGTMTVAGAEMKAQLAQWDANRARDRLTVPAKRTKK